MTSTSNPTAAYRLPMISYYGSAQALLALYPARASNGHSNSSFMNLHHPMRAQWNTLSTPGWLTKTVIDFAGWETANKKNNPPPFHVYIGISYLCVLLTIDVCQRISIPWDPQIICCELSLGARAQSCIQQQSCYRVVRNWLICRLSLHHLKTWDFGASLVVCLVVLHWFLCYCMLSQHL